MRLGVIVCSACFFLCIACSQNPDSINNASAPARPDTQVSSLLNEARSEIEKSNFGRAIDITQTITRSDADNHEAYFLRSVANAAIGNMKEALAAIDESMRRGLKDITRISEEHKLSLLRTTPEYHDLIKKYGYGSSSEITSTEIKAGNVSIKEESGRSVIKAGDISIVVPKN
jgi:hypothetical protein